jgi:hypothetical protein
VRVLSYFYLKNKMDEIEDILNFTHKIKNLKKQSEKVTSIAIKSLDHLDNLIDNLKNNPLQPILEEIQTKSLICQNLNKTEKKIQDLIDLVEAINKDKFNIKLGDLSSIDEYISNLNHLKTFENLIQTKNEGFLIYSTLKNLNSLIRKADYYLADEFHFIINDFSRDSDTFIEYLLNSFHYNDDIEDLNLFIPESIIQKLSLICDWFIKRDNQNELFNNKGEHCDLNEILKFSELRNNYIELIVKKCSKTEKNEYFHSKLKKIFKAKSNKAVEYISIFSESLKFFFKLLKHEKILINKIFSGSDEATRFETKKVLAELIIENIQEKFEEFFINSVDFNDHFNNSDETVREIISLKNQVKLITDTDFLSILDFTSASKFLNFSLKLNEIIAIIIIQYLQVVKSGIFNKYDINDNLTVHSYVIKTLTTFHLIYSNQANLSNAISLACKNLNETDSIFSRFKNNKVNMNLENDNLIMIYLHQLIQSLEFFLINESKKIERYSLNVEKINFLSSKSLYSFKELLKDFKSSIFVLNNYEYIENFLNGLSTENKVCLNSRNYIQNISKMFDFISKEWLKSMKKDQNFFILKELVFEFKKINIRHQKAQDIINNNTNLILKPILENLNYLQMIQIAKSINISFEDNIERNELFKKISDKLFDNVIS